MVEQVFRSRAPCRNQLEEVLASQATRTTTTSTIVSRQTMRNWQYSEFGFSDYPDYHPGRATPTAAAAANALTIVLVPLFLRL